MNDTAPDNSDLEALVNSKIKDAIRAAVDKIGEKELSRITGIAQSRIDLVLGSDEEYLPVKAVSVICQINKSHGDPNPEHSSVSACIKGTTVRLLSARRTKLEQDVRRRETLRPSPDRKPPTLSPCVGSVLGLIIGAFASLAYTYYYFTREA